MDWSKCLKDLSLLLCPIFLSLSNEKFQFKCKCKCSCAKNELLIGLLNTWMEQLNIPMPVIDRGKYKKRRWWRAMKKAFERALVKAGNEFTEKALKEINDRATAKATAKATDVIDVKNGNVLK